MYSARVQIHVIHRMSTQCVREGVHCGVTMETDMFTLRTAGRATRGQENRRLKFPVSNSEIHQLVHSWCVCMYE